MRAQVSAEGVVIPKRMLGTAKEVEIQNDHGVVTVKPVAEADSIFGLGSEPVKCGVEDGSIRHDQYLYGSDK